MSKNIISETQGRLGPRERRMLSELSASGMRLFKTEDAYPFWSSKHHAQKALSRLESKGWLMRLERGLYLVMPLEAGVDRQWWEDPLAIATRLTPDGAVAYWTAMHYWGMTKQIPEIIFVQTMRRRFRPQVTILGAQYQFIQVVERKHFGVTTLPSTGLTFRITDREKTLVDACDRPDLCGGVQQTVEALVSNEPFDWHKVDNYLDRIGSGAIYKRLGYLVDSLDITLPDREGRLDRWRQSLSQGIALLDPGQERVGPVNTAWRIRVNATVLVEDATKRKSDAVVELTHLTPLQLITAALEFVGLDEEEYGFLLRHGRYAPLGRKTEIKVGGMGLADFSNRITDWFNAFGAAKSPVQVVDEGTGELTVYLLEGESLRLEEDAVAPAP